MKREGKRKTMLRQAAEPLPRMRIAQLEGERADLEAALKRAKQRIAQLEGEQEARIAKLEAEVAKLEADEEGALEAELAEALAEILPCGCKLCTREFLQYVEEWARGKKLASVS